MIFKTRWTVQAVFAVAALTSFAPSKAADSDAQVFNRLFADWTAAFNKKDLVGTTNLFSKECIATMPDAPQKNFDDISNGFKKLFALKTERLQYKYKIHQINHSGDLASVRITWYLSTYAGNKLVSTSTEQGLDVFKKDRSGNWKIVNFIAYTEKK